MLSSANNSTTTPPTAEENTANRVKATTELRGSTTSDYNQLHRDVSAIIVKMNAGMHSSSQSFSWRVCGLVTPPPTDENISKTFEKMSESKTHDLRPIIAEPSHPGQSTVPSASVSNSTSLQTAIPSSAAPSSNQSSWSSLLRYFSSFTTLSSPTLKHTPGTTGTDSMTSTRSTGSASASGSGSGFAGSERGYTCGLWLLLHYITGSRPSSLHSHPNLLYHVCSPFLHLSHFLFSSILLLPSSPLAPYSHSLLLSSLLLYLLASKRELLFCSKPSSLHAYYFLLQTPFLNVSLHKHCSGCNYTTQIGLHSLSIPLEIEFLSLRS